jgi:hypothetical protein
MTLTKNSAWLSELEKTERLTGTFTNECVTLYTASLLLRVPEEETRASLAADSLAVIQKGVCVEADGIFDLNK